MTEFTDLPDAELRRSVHALLGGPVRGTRHQPLGHLRDLIVRLRGHEHPPVTGIVVDIGGRPSFVPAEEVTGWQSRELSLTTDRLDLRQFDRRDGEVLLREDILGHRLIDIPTATLVRAFDLELAVTDDGVTLVGVDVRPRSWWRRLLLDLGPGRSRPVTDEDGTHARCRDWKAFEALIGHAPSVLARSPLERLRTLKVPQIADLVEGASDLEQAELLDLVHHDPDLEADVFSELDGHDQTRLLRDRDDGEVAAVLARMRADAAADALMELPQHRRRPVLDLLPAGTRTTVTLLLGYHPTSAGGLMTVDLIALPATAAVDEALDGIRTGAPSGRETLVTVHVLDPGGRLTGVVDLVSLLQADPRAALGDVAEGSPVRTRAEADLVEVAVLMTDYDLLTLPVVDEHERVLGVITVDDVLAAVLPDHWRRRDVPATGDHESRTDAVATGDTDEG